MNRIRQKLIAQIQQASPPEIIGIDAILEAQKAQQQQQQREEEDENEENEKEDQQNKRPDEDSHSDLITTMTTMSMTRGYIPDPRLITHIIPGTQATPLDMSSYIQHVFEQALDEIGLKESILEALQTIHELKDSGQDELPTLLDQQLTNMTLLWELEPYTETVPERLSVEEKLGVMSWQLEITK
ncbi:hypothetical protein BX616_005926 [Lobosporangium transversale]|uniref:Uncharacterized protein n=1 Tax=Lobosporangium transversale TaxID=64571 RepID=A0A1Y2GPD9_9FUNG|nr:hypothetical protein BCR41DRAFT_396717 [Lobosporangium transversale]KAF9897249.1 hypothetical protein BX616_005926 [Lobosporangium transversale]ORZ14999.1 hypothetical protein BCR41DRAFT_396717 [Lobosporangium transversale]|eukprot:XP_021881131.1 hypothetical protein BCR41DRAFT_396717 [Lobosporangium transversale]